MHTVHCEKYTFRAAMPSASAAGEQVGKMPVPRWPKHRAEDRRRAGENCRSAVQTWAGDPRGTLGTVSGVITAASAGGRGARAEDD